MLKEWKRTTHPSRWRVPPSLTREGFILRIAALFFPKKHDIAAEY